MHTTFALSPHRSPSKNALTVFLGSGRSFGEGLLGWPINLGRPRGAIGVLGCYDWSKTGFLMRREVDPMVNLASAQSTCGPQKVTRIASINHTLHPHF